MSQPWKHLARKPGSNYQQLFIKERNIAARTLYDLTFSGEEWPGRTPPELAADYDLPLEAVEEALAYCRTNPPELAADCAMNDALVRAAGLEGRTGSPTGQSLTPEEHEAIVRWFRLCDCT
jgi:hypothetical protein